MTCIKTGANVLLSQYNAHLHGDLFRFGDVCVFCYVGEFTHPLEKIREPDVMVFEISEHLESRKIIVFFEDNSEKSQSFQEFLKKWYPPDEDLF